MQLYDVESGHAKVTARCIVHVSDFHSGQVADFGMTRHVANESAVPSPKEGSPEMASTAMMTSAVGTGTISPHLMPSG